MSLLQEAANFNDRGLAALINGHYASAVESMTQALSLVRQELRGVTLNTSADSSILYSNTGAAGRMQSIQTVEISKKYVSSDTAAIFNHAFNLSASYVSQDITSLPPQATRQVEMNITGSTIIFNLALAHHLQGFHDAQKMMKAEKFYTIAFSLLDDLTYSDIPSAVFIKLACIHNIFYIRVIKEGDQNVARETLDQVSILIGQTSSCEIFAEPNILSLLVSVLLVQPPVAAAAA